MEDPDMFRIFARGALAVLSLGAMAAAHAQDTVSLYGVADAYAEYIRSGAGSVARLQSGGLSASRFGFRGYQDLGGGLNAVFTLEAGYNIDTGAPASSSATFNRQSFVGVGHEDLGQITLGRQYASIWHLSDRYSEFSNSPTGSSTAVIGGFGGYEPINGSNDSGTGSGGPARLNNAVKYESPVWGGFRFGAQGGFGEVVNNAGGNRVYEGYARYTGGPVDVMVSFTDDKGGSVDPTQHHQTWGAAGSYNFGSFNVKAGYVFVNDRTPANQDGDGWWVGADYRIGAHLVKVQYLENHPRYIPNANTQAFGVGYEYSLSKRTTLYSALAYFKNQPGAGLGRASFTIPTGLTNATNNDLTQVVGGMRFTF
jgi:predicted porin